MNSPVATKVVEVLRPSIIFAIPMGFQNSFVSSNWSCLGCCRSHPKLHPRRAAAVRRGVVPFSIVSVGVACGSRRRMLRCTLAMSRIQEITRA